ncbi:unnamed protein product, partial [Symbiodinium sp. KB8]
AGTALWLTRPNLGKMDGFPLAHPCPALHVTTATSLKALDGMQHVAKAVQRDWKHSVPHENCKVEAAAPAPERFKGSGRKTPFLRGDRILIVIWLVQEAHIFNYGYGCSHSGTVVCRLSEESFKATCKVDPNHLPPLRPDIATAEGPLAGWRFPQQKARTFTHLLKLLEAEGVDDIGVGANEAQLALLGQARQPPTQPLTPVTKICQGSEESFRDPKAEAAKGTFVASAGKLGHFPMETLPAGSYGDRLATGRCSNRTARLQMRTSQQ